MGFENGKLVRVSLEARKGGRSEVNTLHYDLVDTIGETANSPQDLADRFRDDVIPSFAAMYDNLWEIQPVVVTEEKDPQNPTDPRSSWTSGTAVTGTQTASGTVGPSGACAVATLHTDSIGRRFRGRMFLGGSYRSSWFEGDLFQAVALTAQQGAFMADIPLQPDIVPGGAPIGGSQANWCVYSRTQRAADLDPYASHVTGYTLHREIHWLRRRAGNA